MISTAARANLKSALDEAGRETRLEWLRLTDEMQRLRGFPPLDRSKPYNKAEVDEIAAVAMLVCRPGVLPVAWRMWILPRTEEIGDPVYPCVELHALDDGYSVHLVSAPKAGGAA